MKCNKCSLFDLQFDIHGGGLDLTFPHHENEIAQNCTACQESSVTYWMHNGHVTNNNETMSKSLGNFLKIFKVIAKLIVFLKIIEINLRIYKCV